MDPSSEGFWAQLPVAIKLQCMSETLGDLESREADEALVPMRALFCDTDDRVASFRRQAGELERVLGGRDVALARARIQLKQRTAAAERLAAFVEHARDVGEDLAFHAGEGAEARRRREAGELLLSVLEPVSSSSFSAVLRALPVLTDAIRRYADVLDGHGFTSTLRAEGEALFEELKQEAHDVRADLSAQVSLTGELHLLLDDVVNFLRTWARRRRMVQRTAPKPLPGFDLGAARAWHATRSSDGRARREAAAEAAASAVAPAPAPAPAASTAAVFGGENSVVADAMAAFRAGSEAT